MPVNQAERAYRAWTVLGRVAEHRELITYGALGYELRIHHRAVKFVLSLIQDYCLSAQLPPLTILVVQQGRDTPGPGFIAWDVTDLSKGRTAVYKYNWRNLTNPFSFAKDGTTEADLVDTLVRFPQNAAAVYARVKVRGVAQRIFRAALLKVYNQKCCFCAFSFTEALEAAHIISWQLATNEQRMSTANGLLLCSTHHRLFDAGYLTLTPSFKIAYSDPKGIDGPYSSSDRVVTINLHGKMAILPRDEIHFPAVEALVAHNVKHGWGTLR